MSKLFSYFSDMAAKRWLLLLCAVVLLHLLVIDFAFLRFRTDLSRSTTPASVAVELISPPATPQLFTNQSTPTAAPSAPPTPPKALRTRSSTTANGALPATPPEDTPIPANSPSAISIAKDGLDLPSLPVDLPPSAELRYKLRLDRKKNVLSGNGRLLWMRSNNQYANIHGKFTVPDVYSLQFLSEGVIHPPQGISPMAYTETRADLPESKTRFEYDSRLIRFSDSQKSHAMLGGEQDIASVIWQLSGIGRQDGSNFQLGAQFQLFVADTKDANIWLIGVVGLEEIDTPLGKLHAWHLLRTAPAGTQEQTVEFWLAPDREWYPVRLRYTEANGDSLELTISEITLVPDT